MAESPDLAALARRYVDLWQDQLTAMAADPALAESTARLLAALVPAGWPPQPRHQDDDAGIFSPGSGTRSTTGPAAAGAASGQRDRSVDKLTRRLAALEKRLAALEAGIRPRGRNAQPRARRRKK
ncbi:MAG TPA: hypothetical protein VGP48_08235 [Stellaceae bacterium]|jgi:hypothetical protein|nr:hypothetical protein [Stellaceae bacterium]